jgi:serine/threonine protein kinase
VKGSTAYTIHRLLGHGGYGKVYQATAKAPDGTKKVVALKLVDPACLSEDNLAGLRDEARIAHLLDHPSVVRVEPPFLLQGLWAVEMEFVDGASLHRILEDHPRVPPRPATELVATVLGALDRLVHQPGPDGRPLAFVHRDLKPGNVQLTPTGDVKILDFGSALATGVPRERATTDTHAVVGTRGYIAPERFEHQDHPKGDVYALGVLLHHLITGALPGATTNVLPLPPEATEALAIAEAMRDREWTERMDAAEAHQRLRVVHQLMTGPTLAEWVGAVRPVPRGLPPDDLVGQVLRPTEHEMPLYGERRRGKTVTPAAVLVSDPVMHSEPGGSVRPLPPRVQAPPSRPPVALGLLFGVLFGGLALACGIGAGGLVAWLVW